MMKFLRHSGVLIAALLSGMLTAAEPEYIQWTAVGDAIPEPLGGLQGDPQRGRAVVIDRDNGNCLACHHMPIPGEPMHGTVGPPLNGVGARLSEGQLRLRVVNEQRLNPNTIMPAFYKNPAEYHRPHPAYQTTVLTAREAEDVVAYLMTLQ